MKTVSNIHLSSLPSPAKLSAWIFAHHCFLCGTRNNTFFCEDCETSLPYAGNACPQCALPGEQNALCPECQQHPPHFYRSVCGFEYLFPLPFIINEFKHRQQLHCGEALAMHLVDKLQQAYREDTLPHLITPVPMHWKRRLARGFNQAEFLALYIARQLNLPVCHTLKKSSFTTSQQSLNRRQRLKNLAQSFRLQTQTEGKLTGMHIAIVDDVITTGATAAILSELFVAAGAARVDIWALARTPKS